MRERAKIVIVGEYAVGKTSLLYAFLKITVNGQPAPTVTPEFKDRNLKTTTGDEIAVDFWDTAGQEQYQSLTPAFVRDCDVVIVCYERGGEAHVAKCAELLRPHNPDAQFVAAVTKADTFEARPDIVAEVEREGWKIAEDQGLQAVHLTSSFDSSKYFPGIAALFGAAGDIIARKQAQQKPDHQPLTPLVPVTRSSAQLNSPCCRG
jgi:small GTP-binding protein